MGQTNKDLNLDKVLPLLDITKEGDENSSEFPLVEALIGLIIVFIGFFVSKNFTSPPIIYVTGVVMGGGFFGFHLFRWWSEKKQTNQTRPKDQLLKSAPQAMRSEYREKIFFPFLEKLPFSVFLIDNQEEFLFINSEAKSLLGLGDKILAELKYQDVFGVGGVLNRVEKRDAQKYIKKILNLPFEGGLQNGDQLVFLEKEFVEGQDIANKDMPVLKTNDLSKIFEGSPLAIATISKAGFLDDFNQSFSKLFEVKTGHKPSLGIPFKEFLEKELWSEVDDRVKYAIEGSPPLSPMDIDLKGEGSTVLQAFFGTGASWGEPSATVFLIDTTDQKRMEVQFVQAQKMQAVGQLAGGIAHDFNNLLTAMIGFCDLLLDRHGPGDPSFSDLMQVKQNANRAANLVRQLLAFSRRQTLRPKVLDVTDVLSELVDLIRRLIGENIEFEVVHGRNLGQVKVDQGQLEQVIINLAVNARDAMLDGGNLSIRTKNISKEDAEKMDYQLMKPAEYICITVSDTGTGIPQEYRDKVFEPFFTTKDVGKGTGLGLSTVYGIVKQTGGFIFIGGEVGEGAIIDVYLPRFKEEVKEAEEAKVTTLEKPKKDISGQGKIMVVEDEDAVRMFATRALSKKGYTVLEAGCGEKALEILDNETDPIDLMISDVVMPSMDGTTLAEKVLEKFPNTKIILISGYAEEAFRKKMEPGKFSFLPKPFSLIQLGEQVKAVLGDSDKK